MNSVHEHCPNSDPKQCTVTKLGCVHSAHTQKPGRARSAQVVGAAARTANAGRALAGRVLVATLLGSLPQVATQNPGRDIKSMSRPTSSLPTETPLSRPKTLVATSNHDKAARIMSRHQIGVATPLRPLQVATLKRGRDIVSLAQPQARSQHQTRSRPSWRLTYVATSISCRDIASALNGLSRSRRQKSRS